MKNEVYCPRITISLPNEKNEKPLHLGRGLIIFICVGGEFVVLSLLVKHLSVEQLRLIFSVR